MLLPRNDSDGSSLLPVSILQDHSLTLTHGHLPVSSFESNRLGWLKLGFTFLNKDGFGLGRLGHLGLWWLTLVENDLRLKLWLAFFDHDLVLVGEWSAFVHKERVWLLRLALFNGEHVLLGLRDSAFLHHEAGLCLWESSLLLAKWLLGESSLFLSELLLGETSFLLAELLWESSLFNHVRVGFAVFDQDGILLGLLEFSLLRYKSVGEASLFGESSLLKGEWNGLGSSLFNHEARLWLGESSFLWEPSLFWGEWVGLGRSSLFNYETGLWLREASFFWHWGLGEASSLKRIGIWLGEFSVLYNDGILLRLRELALFRDERLWDSSLLNEERVGLDV
jgi:hypothetical protein